MEHAELGVAGPGRSWSVPHRRGDPAPTADQVVAGLTAEVPSATATQAQQRADHINKIVEAAPALADEYDVSGTSVVHITCTPTPAQADDHEAVLR